MLAAKLCPDSFRMSTHASRQSRLGKVGVKVRGRVKLAGEKGWTLCVTATGKRTGAALTFDDLSKAIFYAPLTTGIPPT
jgi:hypothetical protein